VLVDCSLRARERGHYAEEAAFWARAANLTADTAQAARSLLSAAQAHFVGGAVNASQKLLARASPCLATPLLQAQAQRLEAELKSFFVPNEIPLLLLGVATSLEGVVPCRSAPSIPRAARDRDGRG
jgi:hypothetical protein